MTVIRFINWLLTLVWNVQTHNLAYLDACWRKAGLAAMKDPRRLGLGRRGSCEECETARIGNPPNPPIPPSPNPLIL